MDKDEFEIQRLKLRVMYIGILLGIGGGSIIIGLLIAILEKI